MFMDMVLWSTQHLIISRIHSVRHRFKHTLPKCLMCEVDYEAILFDIHLLSLTGRIYTWLHCCSLGQLSRYLLVGHGIFYL